MRDAEEHELVAVRCDHRVRLKGVATLRHKLCTNTTAAAAAADLMSSRLARIL
jgi:hypothetical protein